MKLGLPKEYFGDGIDPAVRHQVDKSIKKLEAAGARASGNLTPPY